MNSRKKKLLAAISFSIVALWLSVASVAFACAILGGQTYLATVNGSSSWAAIRPGNTVGLYATDAAKNTE